MQVTKTYIPGLDNVLGGGLLKGSVVALSGAPGGGKSTLGVQFLAEGAKKSGEAGIYITIEESKDKLIEYMQALGYDLRTMEELRQLIVLDFPHHEVQQFVIPSNPIKEIIESSNISRVVIDSVVPIALSIENEYERKKAFLRMIENMSKWNATTLLITEDISSPPGENLPQSKYGVEDLTDGWIHLYYLKSKDQRKRALEVIKLKGLNHSSKIHDFTISKGGIKVQE